MSQTSEALRRMSSRLDMCDCEAVLKAADRIDELEEALRDAISSTHQDADLVDWREDARAVLEGKP
jgi:hypothetical protein